MNKVLIILLFVFALFISGAFFPEGAVAAIVCAVLALVVLHIIGISNFDDKTKLFLTNVFIGGLLIRGLLAAVIFGFNFQNYFGPDAFTYDYLGNIVASGWWGQPVPEVNIRFDSSGWGMPYLVGAMYFVTGQNPLAGQLIISVLGAATAVMAYSCAKQIFQNNRVAHYSALFVAFFPAMFIWSSQLIKDGIIIFLLVLSLLAAMRLQERFQLTWTLYLLIALLGISSLRFYIFFMVTAALLGGFILGIKTSVGGLISRFAVCTIFGFLFSVLGVWQISEGQADKYANLEVIQDARVSAAREANSGLDVAEEDVSTTSGLITALPLGVITLYLAPFPWQVQSITQILTMPEMLLWWISIPFMLTGVVYAVKYRLRECAPILFFTLMLSFSYAVYQGNLGTLYRQRAQIQVFLLIFTAVGVVVSFERKENVKLNKRIKGLPQRLPLAK